MASRNPTTIPPFPDTIDRRDFAIFTSGFTAGEGCFMLWMKTGPQGGGRSKFHIALRKDDQSVLQLIQSFWGCGNLRDAISYTSKSKPQVTYSIDKTTHLQNIVVPHFDQFPMYAKKQNDFLVWKEAVKFAYERMTSSRYGTPWSDRENDYFRQMIACLKECRRYKLDEPIILPPMPLPDVPVRPHQNLLF